MSFRSIILCLATEKGFAVACSLRALSSRHNLAICTFPEKDVRSCYEQRITLEAERSGIPLINIADWRKTPREIVQRFHADAIICVGWKYLIPSEVVELVDGHVIIAHDSLLPKFRGFAPLPTAIITGEVETGVTFLRAAAHVDSGPIYWQSAITIEDEDLISDLIHKLIPLYVQGVQAAISGEFGDPVEQDDSKATYSIWRDTQDYYLNWLEAATQIWRTIRALQTPYLGAKTSLNGQEITVVKGTPLQEIEFAVRQPGKVWSLDDTGRPIVVCGHGLLRIDEAMKADGTSLIPMKRLRARFE